MESFKATCLTDPLVQRPAATVGPGGRDDAKPTIRQAVDLRSDPGNHQTCRRRCEPRSSRLTNRDMTVSSCRPPEARRRRLLIGRQAVVPGPAPGVIRGNPRQPPGPRRATQRRLPAGADLPGPAGAPASQHSCCYTLMLGKPGRAARGQGPRYARTIGPVPLTRRTGRCRVDPRPGSSPAEPVTGTRGPVPQPLKRPVLPPQPEFRSTCGGMPITTFIPYQTLKGSAEVPQAQCRAR